MEWDEFLFSSPFDESLYKGSSSTSNVVWTPEENKVFENTLAEEVEAFGSLAFFQNLATKIPTKSMQDIKVHFEALVHDVEKIESGSIPIPDYDQHVEKPPLVNELMPQESTWKREKRITSVERGQRQKGVPWTEEEHQQFLIGLNKYGKGDWKSISRYHVMSKTPTQVASHAQKYFRRQTCKTPKERRRPSIHDIQTVRHVTTTSPPTFVTNYATAPMQSSLTDNFMSGMVTGHEQNPSTLTNANQDHTPMQLHMPVAFTTNSPMNGVSTNHVQNTQIQPYTDLYAPASNQQWGLNLDYQ